MDAAFDYLAPESIDGVVQILAGRGGGAKVTAGGHRVWEALVGAERSE